MRSRNAAKALLRNTCSGSHFQLTVQMKKNFRPRSKDLDTYAHGLTNKKGRASTSCTTPHNPTCKRAVHHPVHTSKTTRYPGANRRMFILTETAKLLWFGVGGIQYRNVSDKIHGEFTFTKPKTPQNQRFRNTALETHKSFSFHKKEYYKAGKLVKKGPTRNGIKNLK